jgi:hypothetical protein
MTKRAEKKPKKDKQPKVKKDTLKDLDAKPSGEQIKGGRTSGACA